MPHLDELRAQLAAPHLAEVFARLPAAPKLLGELQAAFAASTTNARVAGLLEKDPILLAHVLRVANSPYYSIGRTITSPTLAVAYIGIEEVQRLVTTQVVLQAFGAAEHPDYAALLTHGYLTAMTARALAPAIEPLLDPALIWPCAMLHDVGRLVLLTLDGSAYGSLSAKARHSGQTFAEVEVGASEATHMELGAALAWHWGLPTPIASCCLRHERPQTEGSDDVDAVTRLVGGAAWMSQLALEPLNERSRVELGESVRRLLHLDEAGMVDWMAKVYDLRASARALTQSVAR